MKTKKLIYIALLFIFSINLLSAQEIDNNELAKRILTETFNVQPGEVILVQGGMHTLDLLEAFIIEGNKLGAITTPVIYTDKIQASFYKNVPENYVGLLDDYIKKWFNLIDYYILLPNTQNYKELIKDVPEENMTRAKKGIQKTNQIVMASNVKGCYIPFPNKSMSAYDEPDFNTYTKMHWKAINADYKAIAENAKKIENLLVNSKKVEISSPAGTNISFSVAGRKCFINDGTIDENEAKSEDFMQRWVSFPDGKIYVSIVENSGNGKIVVPKDVISSASNETVENLSFKVKNGKVSNLKAEKGEENFMKIWKQYTGPIDTIAGFQIGLNPEIKISGDEVDYRHFVAEGMVYVIFGDNSKSGGKNKVSSSYLFPITNATVKIDGKMIIENGNLKL